MKQFKSACDIKGSLMQYQCPTPCHTLCLGPFGTQGCCSLMSKMSFITTLYYSTIEQYTIFYCYSTLVADRTPEP